MSQEALFILLRASVPPLHVFFGALPVLQWQKVEKDGRVPSVRIGIFSGQHPEQEELLRGRIRDGGQDDGTQGDAEVELDPVETDAASSADVQQNGTTEPKRANIPSLAEIVRIVHMVRLVLVIDHDQDRSLISEFVLVRVLLGYPPGQSSIGRDERVPLFVRSQAIPDVADSHDETGGGRGKDLAIVVRLGDGPEVQGAGRQVRGVAVPFRPVGSSRRRLDRVPRAP